MTLYKIQQKQQTEDAGERERKDREGEEEEEERKERRTERGLGQTSQRLYLYTPSNLSSKENRQRILQEPRSTVEIPSSFSRFHKFVARGPTRRLSSRREERRREMRGGVRGEEERRRRRHQRVTPTEGLGGHSDRIQNNYMMNDGGNKIRRPLCQNAMDSGGKLARTPSPSLPGASAEKGYKGAIAAAQVANEACPKPPPPPPPPPPITTSIISAPFPLLLLPHSSSSFL
ncbi:protein enabled homolog [Macrobrachium nipponense]|uniref:protein enabled homolog n=1 Tax=Macrobrachium nipponense TaxID=159736 RepID=UPI0030C861E0